MNRLLLLALIAGILSPIAASPIVDPKVHKMCLAAADYMGCVKAQLGLSTPNEIITNTETSTSRGNECPSGYVFMGNGYCNAFNFCRKNSLGYRKIHYPYFGSFVN